MLTIGENEKRDKARLKFIGGECNNVREIKAKRLIRHQVAFSNLDIPLKCRCEIFISLRIIANSHARHDP
jgi:hypothetical protein